MERSFSIVGAGVVGFALGKVLRKAGFAVTFVDTNPERIPLLLREGFYATENLQEALSKTTTTFVCVPTPTKESDGSFDGSIVAEVIENIVCFLNRLTPWERRERFHTIILKSTVLPTFPETLLARINLRLGEDFGFAVNPEFLRSETAEEDVLYEHVVIGTQEGRSLMVVKDVWRTVEEKLGVRFRYVQTNIITALLMKYHFNLWLAVTMPFFMEYGKLCKVLGVNPYEVMYNIPHPDPAVWVRGDFLRDGFLDECLPKDSAALSRLARERGTPLKILEAAIHVNEEIIGSNGHIPYDPVRLKLLKTMYTS